MNIPLHGNPTCNNNQWQWQSQFMGFAAMQNRNAVPLWSYLFELHKPEVVIELGTYGGGFSCCIGILSKNHQSRFITYDHVCHVHQREKDWFELLGVDFRLKDIFLDEVKSEIHDLIQTGKAFVLCDNGHKIEEWKMIAPMLKHGDIIGAHDYMTAEDYWVCAEFDPNAVKEENEKHGIQPIPDILFEKAAWYVCQKK